MFICTCTSVCGFGFFCEGVTSKYFLLLLHGMRTCTHKTLCEFREGLDTSFLQEVGGGKAEEPLEVELMEEASSRLASREWFNL